MKKTLVFASFILLNFVASAQSGLFKNPDSTNRWLAAHKVPALAVGYIEDGKIKELKVFGNRKQGGPYTKNTIFNVASLSKPITALITLKLVEAGKWNLDEPLARYWLDPDLRNDPRSQQLTTRDILSHQSGFPNWQKGAKLAFEFSPGTRYQYSGEGFEYLRKALEEKFDKNLEQLAAELVFIPLGMKDTRYTWSKSIDTSRYAGAFKADGTAYTLYRNTSANAADDLLTTVGDYSRFLVHILKGAGLGDELYRDMVSNQVRISDRKYWGLGWWVDEDVNCDEDALLHGGDDKGVHTLAIILPESKKGLVIFTNSDAGTSLYQSIITHYLGATGKAIIEVETSKQKK